MIARALSLADVAHIAGVSRPTVSRWKKGEVTPRMQQRAALQASLNIPSAAWDTGLQPGEHIPADVHIKSGPKAKYKPGRLRQPDTLPAESQPQTYAHQPPTGNGTPPSALGPGLQPPAAPVFPAYPDAPEDGSTLDMVRHSLACLQHDLMHRGYTASGRSKARADETRTLALIAKLESTEELKQDRYVREHPEWKRLRDCILRALETHPDAAKEVMNAIRLEYVL